tara:strand:- start:2424 stop:3311 length:888 start_codon:yes stop_codon:yes gene_type:complete
MAQNPFRLLELMQKAFGKNFVNQIVGTKANVIKPQKFDVNAPTKAKYSLKAFEDDKTFDIIESQLLEYAPFQLSNRSSQEVANYQANLENYIKARNKRAGESTEFVQPKEETGEIIDLKTKTKVDEEGIASLKERLGLPEGVDPQSEQGQFIQKLQRTETGSPEAESTALQAMEQFFGFGRGARGPDLVTEGKRRAVVRRVLLADDRINLPEDIKTSLSNYDDLRAGGKEEMDPLKIYDQYYERNDTKFEALDNIIEGARDEMEAAKEFIDEFDGFDLIKRDDKADGGLSYLMGV